MISRNALALVPTAVAPAFINHPPPLPLPDRIEELSKAASHLNVDASMGKKGGRAANSKKPAPAAAEKKPSNRGRKRKAAEAAGPAEEGEKKEGETAAEGEPDAKKVRRSYCYSVSFVVADASLRPFRPSRHLRRSLRQSLLLLRSQSPRRRVPSHPRRALPLLSHPPPPRSLPPSPASLLPSCSNSGPTWSQVRPRIVCLDPSFSLGQLAPNLPQVRGSWPSFPPSRVSQCRTSPP